MKKMTIEKAKAELHAAMSGPAGRHWNYGPAVSTVLAALERAEQRIAELESRKVKLPESVINTVCLTAAEIHNFGRGVSDDRAQDIIDYIRLIAGADFEAGKHS